MSEENELLIHEAYFIAGSFPDFSIDVVSAYVVAHDMLTPILALINFVEAKCKVPFHEAAELLETGSYAVEIWSVPNEAEPFKISYRDVRFPWVEERELNIKVQELRAALATLASLSVLDAVPGLGEISAFTTEKQEWTEKYIDTLVNQQAALKKTWDQYKTAPLQSRPLRSVQVEAPASSLVIGGGN